MRKLCLYILLLILSISSFTEASAVPARPSEVTFRRKDGTAFKARIHGDEFCHWITTSEGYNIVPGADGDWYFAQPGKSGTLISTGVSLAPASRLSKEERALLCRDLRPAPTAHQMQMKAYMQASTRSVPGEELLPPFLAGTSMKAVGHQKSLVILVAFADVPFRDSSTPEAFDDLMNGRSYTCGGATGSARQYYYDNSNFRFDPEFTIAGPYTLSHERAYYTANSDAKAPEMAREAAALADADIDFSQYAQDGAGYDIFIYYSGGQEADGSDAEGIWPHRNYFNPIELDGVKLSGYACSSELSLQEDGESVGFTQIGSFCHEFGHTLGLPDFYNTGTEALTNPAGPTNFSLMDVGCYNNACRTPPALNILERWMLGWAQPQVLDAEGDCTLLPITGDSGCIVLTASSGEYFLLECRGAGQNVWDRPEYMDYYGTGAHWGLMAYHVDVSRDIVWRRNTVNATVGGECFNLLFSNPDRSAGYAAAYLPSHCFFPGGSSVRQIRSGHTKGYAARDGGKPAFDITDIELDEAGKEVSFRLCRQTSEVENATAETWQHDALVSWSDPYAAEWTVTYAPAAGGEAKSLTVSTPAAHLPALKSGCEYAITIENDRGGAASLRLTTAAEQGLNPRITLSETTVKSTAPVLLLLCDCKELQDVRWTVDGANTDGYCTLKKGRRRIQATATGEDGSKEYYIRYVNVIL